MVRRIFLLLFAAFCFCGTVNGICNNGPSVEKNVVDLEFRGLSGARHETRYTMFWGAGGIRGKVPSFVKSLNLNGRNVYGIYLGILEGAEWTAVEMRGGDPVALYLDLDSNGGFSPEEKIEPLAGDTNRNTSTGFVTPEFLLTTESGQEVPYRLFLRVFKHKDNTYNFMWSPCCVWEGETVVDGERIFLTLFDTNFNGTFLDYGKDRLLIERGEGEKFGHNPWKFLSTRIEHEGERYRLKFFGDERNEADFSAVVVRDTGQAGELELKIDADIFFTKESPCLRMVGAEDRSIVIDINEPKTTVPAGRYEVERGEIISRSEDRKEMHIDIKRNSEIVIEAGRRTTFEIGRPRLTVVAEGAGFSYELDGKALDVFPRGSEIQFNCRITGKGGEVYHRFMTDGGWKPFLPRVCILDPQGNEVASGTIEQNSFRGNGYQSFTWKQTAKQKSGKYKAVITQDTGLYAGRLKGALEIVLR